MKCKGEENSLKKLEWGRGQAIQIPPSPPKFDIFRQKDVEFFYNIGIMIF